MATAAISIPPRVPRDLKKYAGKLRGFAKKQFKFATSKALNDTAFDVRRSSIALFERSFEVRNKRFISTALRVKKASKRNLEAHVYDRLGRDWLARQVKGGTKTARGKYLAIPVAAKRTARGSRDPRSYAKSFIQTTRSGSTGVFQRFGRGGKRVRMLFKLQPTTRVPKGYPFYKNAKRETRKLFDGHFANAWRFAIRTARL